MVRTIEEFKAALASLPTAKAEAIVAAEARNAQLTKPGGALGRLEDLAIWYAGWRGDARPRIDRVQVVVFAGNHGIAAQGVSAFPADVTQQMVANFDAGGAAINQLCKAAGADLSVVSLDLETPTGDFTAGVALDEAALVSALRAGWNAVDPAADLFVAGEMGIGNTTVAAALAAALLGGGAEVWVGRGTGVDDAGLARKRAVVEAGLARHADVVASGDALAILGALGGRELAAMVGAYARARMLRIPVILDGFIASAAAAVLAQAAPGALDHAVAGHVSAEAAHARLLEALGKEPILTGLGLRLGEASGAAVAIPVLRAAVTCLSDMATFGEAGVADGG